MIWEIGYNIDILLTFNILYHIGGHHLFPTLLSKLSEWQKVQPAALLSHPPPASQHRLFGDESHYEFRVRSQWGRYNLPRWSQMYNTWGTFFRIVFTCAYYEWLNECIMSLCVSRIHDSWCFFYPPENPVAHIGLLHFSQSEMTPMFWICGD